MDISNPSIIRINNRPYRCLHLTNFKQRSKQLTTNLKKVNVDEYDDDEVYVEDFPVTEASNLDEKFLVEEEESEINELTEDVMNLNKLIKAEEVKVRLNNGKYITSVHVPSSCRGYIIGKNCSNIKEICARTKTEINFPEINRRDDPFVILGPSERAVLSAYLKIVNLIQLRRNSIKITHFLAIRCDNEEIRSNYEKFKEIVISKYLPQGFPENVFIGAGKLHLTISLVVLLDNFERNKIVSFMNKSLSGVINQFVKENFKDEKIPFKFNIKGLDYMNDDPSLVKILYGKVDDSTQLIQRLCDKINATIYDLGLSGEFRESVKLHMTLMNARYISHSQAKLFKSFDATAILKDFADFFFGTVTLKEIHLLISGTLDEITGCYKSTHKINIF